jgi:hypothetical protein
VNENNINLFEMGFREAVLGCCEIVATECVPSEHTLQAIIKMCELTKPQTIILHPPPRPLI